MSNRYEAFDDYHRDRANGRAGPFDDDRTPPEPDDMPPPMGEPAQSPRTMRLEWFNAASALALSEVSKPLIEDMLDEGAMSVSYGESNAGKTFVKLDMAMAVATGHPWNGKAVKRGLVVYVAAEGGKRIQRRLAALKKRYHAEHGEGAPEPLLALVRFPIDLRSNDADLKALLALIRSAETESGEKCVWVIVDTLSRALAGGDENSSADMGRIVVAADRIRSETGAHFTYVHHTGKDGARGARGHSLLRAATDTESEVTVGALKVTKQRDMEGGLEFGFTLVDIYIGDDLAGQPIHSAVVNWTGEPQRRESKAKSAPPAQRLLMETIAQAVEESGEWFKPAPDISRVKTIADHIIRERYYARIAEQAKPDEDADKVAERQRKAFNRSIAAALAAKRLIAAEHNGERILWLPY